MPYEVYKTLHILGLLLTFTSLGALAFQGLAGGGPAGGHVRRRIALGHGVGLFLVLLGGFGMMARIGIGGFPWPAWLLVKMAIWVLVAACIVLYRRRPAWSSWLWYAMPVVATAAAYMAIAHPL